MRYPMFRKQSLFVGSRGIEVGCKTVMGLGSSLPAVRTVCAAGAVIALRCCGPGRRFADYWEHRRG